MFENVWRIFEMETMLKSMEIDKLNVKNIFFANELNSQRPFMPFSIGEFLSTSIHPPLF